MSVNRFLSLKFLLAIGFGCALIPLAVAVMSAALAMQRNTEQSERAIYQVVEETKITRTVLQKVGDIERKARLFVLLADPGLRQPYERESYEAARATLKEALSELMRRETDKRIALLANELSEKERIVYEQIMGSGVEGQVRLPVDEAFRGLHEAANALWQDVALRVDGRVNELHDNVASAQRGLFIRGALLSLLALGFIGALWRLLSRSIAQLDQAIRQLGSGGVERPIVVDGPKDLAYLGERLDWLRSRLLALEETKQRFMRNVSEGLEEPLTRIDASLERLPRADGESGTAADELRESVEKLQAMFLDLRQYNRVNDHPNGSDRQRVDLKALVESALEACGDRLGAKSLRVQRLLQPAELRGVPDQLSTVCATLLGNAIDFSPTGGEIRVMLTRADNQVMLEVEDDGPGIAENERAQVFEPFFRGQAARNRDSDGSGMGLAIVSECVANHQGYAEALEPRQDLGGSRIRVSLPIAETDS